jgi:type IV secretory pathway VirB4 component
VRPLRLPALTVTTRHAPSAYPWQCQPGLPLTGPLLGTDALAGGAAFGYDPWECYARGIVSSPNLVVLGQLGKGKSALVKTYLDRQLRAGRQAFVLDPKGEYAALADRHGLPRLRLAPGGSARLNPLDAPAGDPAAAARRRTALVAALVGAGGGRELAPEERAGLAAAVRELPAAPVLADLADRLHRPSAAMAAALHTGADRLAGALRPVALELHRLLTGDLAGMLDGPTTVDLSVAGRGLVLDLAAVFGTDALTPVMVGAGAWLSAAIGAPSHRRRLLLVDEAWALLGSPATTGWLQAVSKLARRHGVQLITVLHRLSDLASQADAGTATRRQAQGLLADAETRVVYAQAPGERALAVELLGLSPAEADLVARLPRHRALWLVGGHAAVVDHVLADGDGALVDTDAAMRA